MWFFACGLVKKLIIADTLNSHVSAQFAASGGVHLVHAWLAALGYSLQLYFDFSGYSDMAVGLAYLLGFRFPQNFDSPFKAKNISDFWRRWHMSLSFWLRDYLFIPLGGSRHGRTKTLRNLLATMFLGGLWHGAAWNFVLWGMLHGAGLVAHRGERQLALPADQQDSARDRHLGVGLRARLEGTELLAELAECPIAVETDRVRVDALRAELFDVGNPPRALPRNIERRQLVGGIGHRRGS